MTESTNSVRSYIVTSDIPLGRLRFDLREFFLQGLRVVMRVLAHQHEAKSHHRFAATIRRHGTATNFMTDFDTRRCRGCEPARRRPP